MKKQLQKMFYYCLPVGMAFIIMMLFSFTVANAQIVYTDVNPDTIITCTAAPHSSCSSMYLLDLNNDGISDFQIDQFYAYPSRNYAHSYVSVSPLGSNKVACGITLIGTFNLVCPLALANGVVIKNNNWYSTSGLMLEEVYSNGLSFTFTCHNWNSVTDKYLGLKLIVGSKTYYGWVRLDVAHSGTSFTVKDYAYNSIPDSAILAGPTITGITENSLSSSINIFPNPASSHLSIALGSNNKKVEVTIADITGKVIYTTIAPDTHMVEVNTKDFAEGIYIVQIQAAGFIASKKLVVEK